MALQTSKLNLTKPSESEKYDVKVWNANMDKIDNNCISKAEGSIDINSIKVVGEYPATMTNGILYIKADLTMKINVKVSMSSTETAFSKFDFGFVIKDESGIEICSFVPSTVTTYSTSGDESVTNTIFEQEVTFEQGKNYIYQALMTERDDYIPYSYFYNGTDYVAGWMGRGGYSLDLNSFSTNLTIEIQSYSATVGCLLEGTEIMTDKGYNRIENVKVGDIVKSKDGTGIVEKVLGHRAIKYYNIEVPSGSIKCTGDHLLLTDKGMLEANSITINEKLVDKDNSKVKIRSVKVIEKDSIVYDIKVSSNSYIIKEDDVVSGCQLF